MDDMLMSFHSSTATPHNNFIAYSGPPTAKNTKKRIPSKGDPKTREDDDPIAPTEDFIGRPGSSGYQEPCGTAIVASCAAGARTNFAADECHVAKDSTTARVDGSDLSAGCLGFPYNFRERDGLDDNLRFQESETNIESAPTYAVAPIGVLFSTAPQAATQGEARRDTLAEDREHESTAVAADLLAADTPPPPPGRGTYAWFKATHVTSNWPRCPSLDILTTTERKRCEREMFCSVDDAMQVVRRRKQARSHSPEGAAEVSDGFRGPVQSVSSPPKRQDDALADSPDGLGDEASDLGHSLKHRHCTSGKHADVDSSDDEIRPWKPRRHRRSIGSHPSRIPDTGSPRGQSRLSDASNGTSHPQRAFNPTNLLDALRPGPPADVEWWACSSVSPDNADPSTMPVMNGSLGLGSSCDDHPRVGRSRPSRNQGGQWTGRPATPLLPALPADSAAVSVRPDESLSLAMPSTGALSAVRLA